MSTISLVCATYLANKADSDPTAGKYVHYHSSRQIERYKETKSIKQNKDTDNIKVKMTLYYSS